MLTRDEAGEVLHAIIKLDVLSPKTTRNLEDIMTCILCEKDGLHLWGADDMEVCDLYSSAKIVAPANMEYIDRLYNKYRFDPSEQEQEDFESRD